MPRARRIGFESDCRFVGLASTDPDYLIDARDKYFAVADFSRARRFYDRVDGRFEHRLGDHHLDLHFGQEIDYVFGTAIELRVPFLTAEAFDFGDGQAADADFGQRLAYLIEFE